MSNRYGADVTVGTDIARVGSVLGDPARASILLELMGGVPLPAGELARRAGVTPSGASNHLRKLHTAGLVKVDVSGRERQYRLAGAEIAAALEALGRIAPNTRERTLRAAEKRRVLGYARTCYDHLAGKLGVTFTERLVDTGVLEPRDGTYVVTGTGRRWLDSELGIATDEIPTTHRRFAYACIDLTERRPHVAGALGAAVADAFFSRGLVRRMPGSRALQITGRGTAYLTRTGLTLE
jgi:DNA-binding transcriptional ArsR family regulator